MVDGEITLCIFDELCPIIEIIISINLAQLQYQLWDNSRGTFYSQ